MALHKLVLPKMGESVTEATVTNWLKDIGDTIQEDEAVLEIATDKVDSDVPSPVIGILKEKLYAEGDTVQVGEAIALIETDAEAAGGEESRESVQEEVSTTTDLEKSSSDQEVINDDSEKAVESTNLEASIPGLQALDTGSKTEQKQEHTTSSASSSSSSRFYSPLVRSIAQEEGVSLDELAQVKGSGAEGRLTKDDVLHYITQKQDSPKSESTNPSEQAAGISDNSKQDRDTKAAKDTPSIQTSGSSASSGQNREVQPKSAIKPVVVAKGEGDEIMEMDRMRRLIADHMVQSVHTSPHVFSAVEADVTNLVNWRNRVKEGFKKREGENITFTPLIIEAISKALKDFPMVNVSVDGYQIIRRKHINISMATALPNGNLIVPVIKNADQLSLVGISHAVNDLAQRARGNKLRPDDTQGGTFTFTNIGAFGNIFGMPIINQPQAAILAAGTIKKKPAVIETPDGDLIGIRHFMYITMSYDHRVIDGALGGTFIKRVADYLENWDVDRDV